jgi:hypothetical protein
LRPVGPPVMQLQKLQAHKNIIVFKILCNKRISMIKQMYYEKSVIYDGPTEMRNSVIMERVQIVQGWAQVKCYIDWMEGWKIR